MAGTADIRKEAAQNRAVGPWKEGWRSFKKSKISLAGAGIVIFFIVLAVFGPLIAPQGINEQDLTKRLLAPSSEHWFGTDDFGRDIFFSYYPRCTYFIVGWLFFQLFYQLS